MRGVLAASLVLIAASPVLVTAACEGRPRGAPSVTVPGEATVVHVVDGDTIDVDIAGRRERVRLLGIDTPESVDRNRPVMCFGHEATEALRSLLPLGARVGLERDVELRDDFGRLLAYVNIGGLSVNLEMLTRGLADVLIIAPNLAHASEYRTALATARAAGVGLWSACPDAHTAVGPPAGAPGG